jgi:hypothetical protein
MINNGWVFPIGIDNEGRKFHWVEDDTVVDCSKCCFWEGRCRYFDMNSEKSGNCWGNGYFKR